MAASPSSLSISSSSPTALKHHRNQWYYRHDHQQYNHLQCSMITIIINTIISRCSSLPSPPSLFPVAINEPSCRCPDRKSAFRGPFVFGRTSWQVPVMSRRQQFQVWGLRIFVLRASSSLGTADIFTAMEPLIRVQEVAAGGTCFYLTWK